MTVRDVQNSSANPRTSYVCPISQVAVHIIVAKYESCIGRGRKQGLVQELGQIVLETHCCGVDYVVRT